MTYKNRELCKVRTITTFICLRKERGTWEEEVLRASHFCTELSSVFAEKYYTVQSVRIVTNPFGEY